MRELNRGSNADKLGRMSVKIKMSEGVGLAWPLS